MLGGMRDILVISTPQDLPAFERLLGDGSQWGLSLCYMVQPSPDGLAQAFLLGRDFLGRDPSCLVLGDNIFYGQDLSATLQRAAARADGRHGLRLPRAQSVGVRRGRVRRRRQGDRDRGEARPPALELRGDRPLLLRRPRGGHRRRDPPLGAGRAGDLRRERALPRTGRRSRSRSSGAAPRGSTPARTSHCSRRAPSSRRSRSGRDSRSPARRRSRIGWGISTPSRSRGWRSRW